MLQPVFECRTFPTAKNLKAKTDADKDPPEKAQEKRRHLVEYLAYILLGRPRFIVVMYSLGTTAQNNC